jgi:hypothetical protein
MLLMIRQAMTNDEFQDENEAAIDVWKTNDDCRNAGMTIELLCLVLFIRHSGIRHFGISSQSSMRKSSIVNRNC